MTQLNVSLYSLTSRTPLLSIQGSLEFSLRVPLAEQSRVDDILYVTKPNDRLSILAYTYYGDVRLWWVIYDNNASQISGHPLNLPVGITLRIPSASAVEQEVIDAQSV